jgi:S1-C subfamily serine protease
MRTRIALCLAAFLVAAVLAGLVDDLAAELQGLRRRVDESASDLTRAQIEVARLRAEAARPAPPRDVDGLHRDILSPSVQVNGNGGVGGGTLLYSAPDLTLVVTAFHVIQKVVHYTEDGVYRDPVQVTLYGRDGRASELVESELVAYDEGKDLALLHLRTTNVYPNVARLASREQLRGIRVFTPVYTVGCPLGHDPLPTLGEIATLRKDVNGERFWMMNAPTIFGNSGGGVFHRETREMVGVSVMICTYSGAVATPVPHLGILVSLADVYDWLDSLGYPFVYDPAAAALACELTRRAPEFRPPDGPPREPATAPSALER